MLLGGIISNDLKWKGHILNGIKASEVSDGKKSILNILVTRLNALRKISKFSSFKVRKMIGSGIFKNGLFNSTVGWMQQFSIKFIAKVTK